MWNWIVDPHSDSIRSGGKNIEVKDAYSQWLFYWGADFRASSEITNRSPSDFNYFVHSKKLTKAKRPKAIKHGNGNPVAGKKGMVSLLPVADRSIYNGDLHKAGHQPADNDLDTEKLVIIGVIDDGVNVFNQRFRPKSGASRIEYCWVQDGPAPTENATVPFGLELTGQQITLAMDSKMSERALLVEYGLSDGKNQGYCPSVFAHESNHGTQIADLAAGADPDDGSVVNTRIITVQLPAYSVRDTSGASLISAMHHAAIYVFDRARAMSAYYLRPLPVVLNISFGLTGGPRNGQQFLERALRALAIKYQEDMRKTFGKNSAAPAIRVMSAGNENILRLHAQSDGTDLVKLPMRIQPEDKTASFIEIWLPESARSAELEIRLPNGQTKSFSFGSLNPENPSVFPARILTDPSKPARPIARLTLDAPHRPSGNGNDLFWRVVICIAPSKTAVSGGNSAPAGVWMFDVHCPDISGKIHSWVLRDEPVSGFASQGRQAYFDDDYLDTAAYGASAFDRVGDIAVDDPAPNNSAIARNGAISGLATNGALRQKNGKVKKGDGPRMDVISVGAMRWDQGQGALYSAADIVGNGQAPMVMAPAETSRVLPNIRASGLTSGTSSALNGTSAAAPIVTRILAARLSAMAPSDYDDFDALAFLEGIGTAPARPDGQETATRSGIRVERLRDGGVTLPLPAKLTANVKRDGLAKL